MLFRQREGTAELAGSPWRQPPHCSLPPAAPAGLQQLPRSPEGCQGSRLLASPATAALPGGNSPCAPVSHSGASRDQQSNYLQALCLRFWAHLGVIQRVLWRKAAEVRKQNCSSSAKVRRHFNRIGPPKIHSEYKLLPGLQFKSEHKQRRRRKCRIVIPCMLLNTDMYRS